MKVCNKNLSTLKYNNTWWFNFLDTLNIYFVELDSTLRYILHTPLFETPKVLLCTYYQLFTLKETVDNNSSRLTSPPHIYLFGAKN